MFGLIRFLAKIGLGLARGHKVIQAEMAQFDKVKQSLEKGIAMIHKENNTYADKIAKTQARIDRNLDAAQSALDMIGRVVASEAPSSPWPPKDAGGAA